MSIELYHELSNDRLVAMNKKQIANIEMKDQTLAIRS